MRGVVADCFIEAGFRRNCGVCGAGLRRIRPIQGLRGFLRFGLPTHAVHPDADCFARWIKNGADA